MVGVLCTEYRAGIVDDAADVISASRRLTLGCKTHSIIGLVENFDSPQGSRLQRLVAY